jgi:hypothetical protein
MGGESFLAIEPELVARLKARLAAAGHPKVHVLTAAELGDVLEEKQLVPAVHVVFQGYGVAETNHNARAARVTQTWLAVVATRNARTLKAGDAARSQAGELAGHVAGALMGWQPAVAARPLRLVGGPGAGFTAGHQYIPLAFEAEIILKPA